MKNASMVGAGILALVVVGQGSADPVPPLKPVPSVEFTDPVGDVKPKYGSDNGPGNDRDVVKASVGSDGSSILVSATISEDEHGTMAAAVLDMYIDTDNNAATGGKAYWGRDAKPPKAGLLCGGSRRMVGGPRCRWAAACDSFESVTSGRDALSRPPGINPGGPRGA